MHFESGVAVALVQVKFGNPGRGKSAVRSRYQRTRDEKQTDGTQGICNDSDNAINLTF